jgi:hypothetical protein
MNYSYDKLRELIPLFLSNRLSEKEKKLVEEALNKYPELRHEIIEFSEIKEAYNELKKDIPSPSDQLYEKIKKRIQKEKKFLLIIYLRGYINNYTKFLKDLFLPNRISWGIAVAEFIIILILVLSLLRNQRFYTLSQTSEIIKRGIKINIIFDKESKEKEIRDLLNKVGATIIKGPTPEGLYTIEIKNNKEIERVLNILREEKFVKFVEKFP